MIRALNNRTFSLIFMPVGFTSSRRGAEGYRGGKQILEKKREKTIPEKRDMSEV